ncbi:flippase [Psychromonas arctica]|uniref:flippase n=1 Tax=Psychromonas arctica TaxID=168275 RepID=UPI002FCF29DE
MKVQNNLTKIFLRIASIQLFSRGIALLSGVIVARVLGPEGYGYYTFVLSTIIFAMIPSIAGLPPLLIREIAKYRIEKAHSLFVGILIWSKRHVMSISLIMTMIYCYISLWIGKDSSMIMLMLIGSALISFKGLIIRHEAILNGLQHPALALLPMAIFAPLTFLVIISISYYFYDVSLDVEYLLYFQIIVHILALVLSGYLVRRIRSHRSSKVIALFEKKHWYKALMPFTMLTLIGAMSGELATILLGILSGGTAVGYFKVAIQAVSMFALGLDSVNKVTAPKIASLYNQGDFVEMQRLLKSSVRISVLSSLPFALLLIVFGKLFVTLLFGETYLPAYNLILILCLGQIFNVGMGSVGLVMNMTGHERRTLRTDLIVLFVSLVLLISLIPLYGAMGAAITVTIAMIVWNIIMAIDVYRLTGLKTWLR